MSLLKLSTPLPSMLSSFLRLLSPTLFYAPLPFKTFYAVPPLHLLAISTPSSYNVPT